MTKRILRELRIDKVAAVDRPCQEHASADIMKRKFTEEERRAATASGHAMSDGSYPIDDVEDLHNAIHAIGRGSGSHTAIRAHIVSRAKALGATASLPEEWGTTEKIMYKELAKALGLPETATEDDVTKAVVKLAAEENSVLKASLEKSQADLATVQADLAKAMAAKKPDVAAAEDEDCTEDGVTKGLAFKAIDGSFISKKLAGKMYDVLKSNDAQLRKNAEDIAKRDETDVVADMTKRSVEVGFGAEFGPTLRKAYGGDFVAQTEIEKRIKGLQEQVKSGDLFKNYGGSGGDPTSAETELLAKVSEVKKADPKLSAQQAYSKAYTDPANADIVKRMKIEASA